MRYRISYDQVRASDHFEQRRQERGISHEEVQQLLADAYVSTGEDGAKLLTHPDSDLVVVYRATSGKEATVNHAAPLPVLVTIYRAAGLSPGGPRRSPRTCCWRRERQRPCAHASSVHPLDARTHWLPRRRGRRTLAVTVLRI
jgi:hypothetical protein